MKSYLKLSAAVAIGLMAFGTFTAPANAAGPYSCSDSTYGGSYSSCSANNTANQASTVATATTVLRAATSRTTRIMSDRISAALNGNIGSVDVASNSLTASSGMAAGDMAGKMGAWITGSWGNVEDDNTDTAFDGDTYNAMIGVDYIVSPGVLVGLSLGYEDVDIDTAYNGFNGQDGNLSGDGYTVAPYVGVKFSDQSSADLTVGYSDIEYDTVRFDPNTGNRIAGSTDADRYFVSAGVNHAMPLKGNWTLEGRGGITYAYEDKDGYTETEAGGTTIAVDSYDTELGQILADARFAYPYKQVKPYGLVGLEYDFVKEDTPVAAGQTLSDDDFGVKFGAGINLINMGSNVTGGVEAYTVEFRDDYEEYVVNAGLRVKF